MLDISASTNVFTIPYNGGLLTSSDLSGAQIQAICEAFLFPRLFLTFLYLGFPFCPFSRCIGEQVHKGTCL